MTEQVQKLVEWAERFVATWQEWWDQAKPAFIKAAQGIRDAFWRAYSEAGCPYGESEEGMLHWLKEKAEERRQEERRREELWNRFYVVGFGRRN